MARLEQKVFKLNDAIAALRREEQLVAEELSVHRLIDDDAQRDAAVSGHPIDRADARDTEGDVARFESSLDALAARRRKLEQKRDRLLQRLR
jgi:hypothetical protein